MNETLLLERYKYVLDQKKNLNDATFKVAAFFQAVLLVILGAQFRILELAQKKEVTVELARLGSWGLFWAVIALGAVSILLIVGGIATWFDYRREESELELLLGGTSRHLPSLRGLLRWYETYIVAIIVTVAAAYWYVLHYVVLPSIQIDV